MLGRKKGTLIGQDEVNAKFAILYYLGIHITDILEITAKGARNKSDKAIGQLCSLTGMQKDYWKNAYHINKDKLGEWKCYEFSKETLIELNQTEGTFELSDLLDLILQRRRLVGFIWLGSLDLQPRNYLKKKIMFSKNFEDILLSEEPKVNHHKSEELWPDISSLTSDGYIKDGWLAKIFTLFQLMGRTPLQSSQLISYITGHKLELEQVDYVKYAYESCQMSNIKSTFLRSGAADRLGWIEEIITHLNRPNGFLCVCAWERSFPMKYLRSKESDLSPKWILAKAKNDENKA